MLPVLVVAMLDDGAVFAVTGFGYAVLSIVDLGVNLRGAPFGSGIYSPRRWDGIAARYRAASPSLWAPP